MLKKLKHLGKHFSFLLKTLLYKPKGAILNYHRVTQLDYDFPGPDEYTVSPDVFEEHLDFLDREFTVLPLKEFLESLQRNDLPEKSIAITFDDGYRDTYTEALPLLKDYSVPVTVFVSSGFLSGTQLPVEFRLADVIRNLDELKIDLLGKEKLYVLNSISQKISCYQKLKSFIKYKDSAFRDELIRSIIEQNCTQDFRGEKERLMLNWEECTKLSNNSLITIGSHGSNHCPLTVYNSEESLYKEVNKSKSVLEKRLKTNISFFSYPYGVYNSKIVQMVERAGYTAAFSTKESLIFSQDKNELFDLPRKEAITKSLEGSGMVTELTQIS